jgi:hypothetical protein
MGLLSAGAPGKLPAVHLVDVSKLDVSTVTSISPLFPDSI